MSALPPLDMHAHIDPTIDDADLEELGAVIFAVTRSLTESEQALKRRDRTTIWGVGCHPAVGSAQQNFESATFADLIQHTAFAGELGLDGKSPVLQSTQLSTLRSALAVLATTPRIVSLHSYAATEPLLDLLEANPVRGVVLHWWLGNQVQTARAVELGCYFSVNAANSIRRPDLIQTIPLDRLLTETDHPFGDRRSHAPHRPGNVEDVETAFGRVHGVSEHQVRLQMWQNLGTLLRLVGCSSLLPRTVRSRVAAVLTAKP